MNVEWFTGLFDEHAPGLWRFLARQVGAVPAEDLVAETYLTAWTARGEYRAERGSGRSWLYGIAVNLLRRHHRVQAQQERLSQRLSGRAQLDEERDRVEERLDARTEVAGLASAIAALADGDREVLLLNSLAGFGAREIAAALGIPEGTVRSRLHRVRRDLRAASGRAAAHDAAAGRATGHDAAAGRATGHDAAAPGDAARKAAVRKAAAREGAAGKAADLQAADLQAADLQAADLRAATDLKGAP